MIYAMLQRLFILIFALVVTPTHAMDQAGLVNAGVAEPQIDARSWLLVDQDSGAILAAGSPDMRIEPASLTKLMTAYIVFLLWPRACRYS